MLGAHEQPSTKLQPHSRWDLPPPFDCPETTWELQFFEPADFVETEPAPRIALAVADFDQNGWLDIFEGQASDFWEGGVLRDDRIFFNQDGSFESQVFSDRLGYPRAGALSSPTTTRMAIKTSSSQMAISGVDMASPTPLDSPIICSRTDADSVLTW